MDPTKNDEARRKLTDKGSSLVTSLKLRISRLETTLRGKEAELAKLKASIKATTLNEMKIEAETYYQEVVRLRNQLNIVQQQQQQHQDTYFPGNQQQEQQQQQQQATPSHSNIMRGKREGREMPQDRRGGGDGQESPSSNLRQALAFLEEENGRLVQKVSGLVLEKEKLMGDLERVLGVTEEVKGNFEGLSRAELIREVERREAEVLRWEAQHKQLTEALGRHSEQVGENSALLQARVAELQGREEEWNRERSSLQELINTLKDDRIYYKETAQKKDSELEGLRQEVHTLQQELLGLQGAQRRRLERASPSTTRTARTGLALASRSGSSSEGPTPTRRPRPSSARPPSSSSSTRQRLTKASSEPRETPSPSRHRTLSQKDPRKLPQAKSTSRSTPSTRTGSSSRSETSPRKPAAPPSRLRQSRVETSSSSLSSKTSTPITSPSKAPSRMTSASSSSQHRSSLSSPRSKQVNGVASQRNEIRLSRVKAGSPVKTPTPRSSSGSSTPSSQVRSSPSKVPASRSPSKVPQPSPRGRKGSTEAVMTKQNVTKRTESSGLSSAEEDERVLAELIFQRDSDSSDITLDTPQPTPMPRQRTVTLDTQEEEEEEEAVSSPQSISKEEVKEEVSPARRRRRKNREISESLEFLRSLLSGHLSRQKEVNNLLTSAPLLVGEGQGGGASSRQSPEGGTHPGRSERRVPEGAEGGKSPLVRQGTFNIPEEGDVEGSLALHATLDAHLTRARGVRQFK